MNNFEERALPLGAVVSLEDLNEKIMIIGYASLNGMEEFDYYGCLYPKGFSGVESVVCFNHEDINEVYVVEFDDEDSGT